jgi:hypothetical protein
MHLTARLPRSSEPNWIHAIGRVDFNAEDEEELMKLLTRLSRLILRSFNLQEWSQDGSARKNSTLCIGMITGLLSGCFPVNSMTGC